jgi:hypothetical protein
MRQLTGLLLALVLSVVCCQAVPARAQTGEDEKAKEPPPKHAIEKANDQAKAAYAAINKRMARLGAKQITSLKSKDGFGLDVGTKIAPMLETDLWGYRFSGDVKWLDRFVRIMTALEKALVEDPDGHLGWYSAPSRRGFGEPWPPKWPDRKQLAAWQQGEARVIAVCAEFEMTVADDAALAKYLDDARRWTRLAEERLLPKWKRCYAEVSHDRGIYTWPTKVFRKGGTTWEPYPGMPHEKAGLTLGHAALSEIILRDLKLWQLRGKSDYRARAAKLLRWQKSCLRFYRGGRSKKRGMYRGRADKSLYWWNQWDPADDYDFRPEGGLAIGMYTSLNPLKAARDVEAFVEAYHTGVVIDREDIERLVNTQMKKMATGDIEKPSWRDMRGEKRGMLWPQLAEFDDRIEHLLWTTLPVASNEFGSILRFYQEKPRWLNWTPRKMGKAKEITGRRTHEDFRKEMDDLIRRHPPPDPSKPRRR